MKAYPLLFALTVSASCGAPGSVGTGGGAVVASLPAGSSCSGDSFCSSGFCSKNTCSGCRLPSAFSSLRELVTLYFKQTTAQMEELGDAIKAADASGVQRVAHSCAGASATCGMILLAPILRELEKQGHDRNLANSGEHFARATAEFERIKKFLTDYLAVQSAQPKVPA